MPERMGKDGASSRDAETLAEELLRERGCVVASERQFGRGELTCHARVAYANPDGAYRLYNQRLGRTTRVPSSTRGGWRWHPWSPPTTRSGRPTRWSTGWQADETWRRDPAALRTPGWRVSWFLTRARRCEAVKGGSCGWSAHEHGRPIDVRANRGAKVHAEAQ